MTLVRCPQCGATCKATDESCFICGCKLSDKELPPINKVSTTNVENSDSSENRYIEAIKQKVQKEKKTYIICILCIFVLFIIALIHAILVKVDCTETYQSGGETQTVTFQTFSTVWVVVTVFFAIFMIILIFRLVCMNLRKILVNYVDGYCVMAYGIGSRWYLYVNGVAANTKEYFMQRRMDRIPHKVELRATLPNNQKILAIIDCFNNESCKIEKID